MCAGMPRAARRPTYSVSRLLEVTTVTFSSEAEGGSTSASISTAHERSLWWDALVGAGPRPLQVRRTDASSTPTSCAPSGQGAGSTSTKVGGGWAAMSTLVVGGERWGGSRQLIIVLAQTWTDRDMRQTRSLRDSEETGRSTMTKKGGKGEWQ